MLVVEFINVLICAYMLGNRIGWLRWQIEKRFRKELTELTPNKARKLYRS